MEDWQKNAKLESSDMGVVLRMSRSAAYGPVGSGMGEIHLRAAAEAVEQVFSFGVGELVGGTTLSHPDGDVFAARWKPNRDATGSGILGITVWDSPEYNFFILQCTEGMFETASAANESLKRILAWKRGNPVLQSVRMRYGRVDERIRFVGSGFLAPHFEFGSEFQIVAFHELSGVNLIFKIGKAPFAYLYPEESVYVPERFPSLRERIANWSRDQILREIGRMWSERGPIQIYPNRDRILIHEALIRGVSEGELREILIPRAPRADFLPDRVATTIGMLVSLNKVGRYRNVIVRSMLEQGRSDRGGSRIAEYLFRAVLSYRAEDFTREALECVATCVNPEGAFIYLQERGTEETVRALEESPVPQALQAKREATVERMRRRLDRERQNRR